MLQCFKKFALVHYDIGFIVVFDKFDFKTTMKFFENTYFIFHPNFDFHLIQLFKLFDKMIKLLT